MNEESRPRSGIVITLNDIWKSVQSTEKKVEEIVNVKEDITEMRKVQDDHEVRLREQNSLMSKIVSQIAVLWAINTLVIASITAIVTKALTGGI